MVPASSVGVTNIVEMWLENFIIWGIIAIFALLTNNMANQVQVLGL